MINLVEITPTFVSTQTFHLRWGFILLGFPNQWDSSLNTIHEPYRCVFVALREIQSVERRLESFSGEYRDGRASSRPLVPTNIN